MYAVNIALGTTVWRLLFKTEEKAREAFAFVQNPLPSTSSLKNAAFKVEDDYGQTMGWTEGAIAAMMFEDLDQSKLANIELFLHQQRVQVAAQKAAQSDPGLKASSLMNGPSVLTPNFQRQ